MEELSERAKGESEGGRSCLTNDKTHSEILCIDENDSVGSRKLVLKRSSESSSSARLEFEEAKEEGEERRKAEVSSERPRPRGKKRRKEGGKIGRTAPTITTFLSSVDIDGMKREVLVKKGRKRVGGSCG